jgi:hypothetical protein
MTALPTSIRIGPVRYTVLTDAAEIKRVSDEADLGSGGEWAAFSDHDRLIIGINPEHAEDNNRVSVLHEVLHCCLRASGVWPNSYARLVDAARGQDGDIPVEEFTVAALAGPMLGVLRDNPDLAAWLNG